LRVRVDDLGAAALREELDFVFEDWRGGTSTSDSGRRHTTSSGWRGASPCTVAPAILVLTWNLFHGRAQPPAGAPLAAQFAAALAGWEWDVAMLQEVPPWWPEPLARAAGARVRWAPTSRNQFGPVTTAIAKRDPDLMKAWGGGCNALLVRGEIRDHRIAELTRLPERRVAHGVLLDDGSWVVNLHATTEPKARTRADCALALGAALEWAAGAPLVFGGDFNLDHPAWPAVEHVAGHHVDHLHVSGWEAGGSELLDNGVLSDHRPLRLELRRSSGPHGGRVA
jgi:endonuclease/exonuclease/phosphatase family metal-dependent hydrolase